MTPIYPYDIAAHQSRVQDLPQPLLQAIREVMLDSSYGDDESAKFEYLVDTEEGKALRLWIDHKDVEKRCEESEFRFSLSYVDVEVEHPSFIAADFSGFLNYAGHPFFLTNDFDKLAAELSDCIPLFNEKFKEFSDVNSTTNEHCAMITKIQIRNNEYKDTNGTTKIKQIEVWMGGLDFVRDVRSESDIKLAERLAEDAGETLYRIDLEQENKCDNGVVKIPIIKYYQNSRGYWLSTDLFVDVEKLQDVVVIENLKDAEGSFRKHNGSDENEDVFIPAISQQGGVLFCQALNACESEINETIENFISHYDI